MSTNIEHIKYALPNIILHIDRTQFPNAKVGVWESATSNVKYPASVSLDEVIKKLAIKFPTHKFVGNCVNYPDNADDTTILEKVKLICAKHFEVYEIEGELVGKIGCVNRYTSRNGNERVIYIKGYRVQHMRERKKTIETANAKRAIAIATKVLQAKSLSETLERTYKRISGGLYQTEHGNEREFQITYDNIMSRVVGLVMKNFETFEAIFEGHLDKNMKKAFAELPDKHEKMIGARELRAAENAKQGYFVQIKNNKYIVRYGKQDPVMYTQDTVPDWLKRNIGMLKLVNEHTAITNVGYKDTEDGYFIVKENKDV